MKSEKIEIEFRVIDKPLDEEGLIEFIADIVIARILKDEQKKIESEKLIDKVW